MLVPAGLRPSDLDTLEPDHGPTRHYRVTLTNERTGETEVHEVTATNCAQAKGRAEAQMTMRLMGDPLTNDVVRLDV